MLNQKELSMKTKHIGKAVHPDAGGKTAELETHARVVAFAKRTQPQFKATLSLRLGGDSDQMQGVLAGPVQVQIEHAKKAKLA
jgi:hypothetical protein